MDRKYIILRVGAEGMKALAISHLRVALSDLAKIPEEDAGADCGNLSAATDHIEAALSRLGFDSQGSG